ncbi:MAG: hypothetical protein L0241_01835 [Planctomycetia bacterium]|nr:hypothetical protein [Planctomycetia bacterium]
MKPVCLLVASVLLLVGSSKEPQKLDTDDPIKYAERVKVLVYEMDRAIQKQPSSAETEGAVVLEELEVYKNNPVGDYEATYAQLLQKCQDLVTAAKRKDASKVSRIRGEMKALADKLPGTVTLPDRDDASSDPDS